VVGSRAVENTGGPGGHETDDGLDPVVVSLSSEYVVRVDPGGQYARPRTSEAVVVVVG
jgi:hypothetical protein